MSAALLDTESVGAADTAMKQYLQEIRQFPLLSAEQERELAMGCARGEEAAIRTMVNSNLRLVVSIARSYAGQGVPMLDLIQEGSIGLLEAAKRFDYTLECRFSTYAAKWIRQGIRKCCLTHGSPVHIPLHTAEKMRKILAASNALRQECGQEPTLGQIAQRSGLSEEKVQRLMLLMPEVCSLDVPVGENPGDTLQQLLQNTQSRQPQEALVREELKNTLEKLMGMLTSRQQQVLRMRFGMEDGICHSQQSIANVLAISKERVRQIEQQSMERLQALGADFGLEDFLE